MPESRDGPGPLTLTPEDIYGSREAYRRAIAAALVEEWHDRALRQLDADEPAARDDEDGDDETDQPDQ